MHRLLSLTLILLILWVLPAPAASLSLGANTTISFATIEQGRQVLTNRDDFVRAMSPFDRALRMKTDKEVTEQQFLVFVGQHNLEWNGTEKEKVAAALKPFQEKLEALALPFPENILLIKTTGAEDSNLAYTRANAIILPQATIAKPVDKLTKTLIHELFHVLSRANPGLRDRLYASIGFLRCEEVKLPPDIKARKITNPDAPANDHCILLKAAGKDVWAVPVLYGRTERYDPASKASFFSHFELRLLVADRKPGQDKPGISAGDTRLVSLKDTTGFFEQIGRNTTYIIHPEEIVADNFALLVGGSNSVPTPVILEKMEKILREKRP